MPGFSKASGPPLSYSRRPAGRPRRPAGRLGGLALAILLGGFAGACSISYQLESLSGQEDRPDRTGSIAAPRAARGAAATPAESDLALARAAASDLLGRGGKDSSAPWENPRTGARGTVTPIAAAYTQEGFVCRDFLASYVREGTEAWLQGEACRLHQGKWEVRSLKPWKRTT